MPTTKDVRSDKNKKWTKSRKDRIIDGVCAGLAEHIGADVTLVRIIWVLTIFIKGLGLIAYILAAIIVPVNPEHKSLKPEEKKKTNHAVIWSLILILLGVVFLWDRWEWQFFRSFPFDFNFLPWVDIPWNSLLPLALILLGVVYIVIALRKDQSKPAAKDEASSTSKTKVSTQGTTAAFNMVRSREDKLLGGVCAAIAKRLDIDTTLIRIAFIVVTLFTHVFLGIIAYVALVLIIPIEDAPSDPAKTD
jgi:phage shock protein C